MLNFIIGFVVGGAVVYFIMLTVKKPNVGEVVEKRDIMEEAKEKHAEMISKPEAYLAGKTEVANDEIQSFLGVSDASAERYLDELESQGRLTQIGKTGTKTHYQIKQG